MVSLDALQYLFAIGVLSYLLGYVAAQVGFREGPRDNIQFPFGRPPED
jgi:hypothetical protein